jgi:VWFA-related protein
MRYWVVNTGSAARILAGLLVLLASSAALPQDPVLKTRPKDRNGQLNAARRMTINVQVTDAAGNPVSRLREDDFTLLDNHQPRRIASFHSIDGAALNDATEVLILLDAVNTPAQALDQEKNAIFKYLAESRKPMPFPTAFALWFNGHVSATPATTDRNEIGRAFVKLTKNVHSNACGIEQTQSQQNVSANKEGSRVSPATCRAVHFKDSIAALDGIAQQQLATGGRTLLIWMGSGWPEIPSGELQQFDPKQRDAYAREFVQVLHKLQAAQMSVYQIATESKSREFKSTAEEKPDASPRIAVDEFAHRTGGLVNDSGSDLTASLRACIRDAEWYYSVSFNVPPPQSGARELHSIEVKVNKPDLQVRTTTSYYIESR